MSSRIAVLKADTLLLEISEKTGDLRDIFEQLLVRGGLDLSAVTVEGYDVVTKQEYPSSLQGLNGIIITGSKHNAFENDEWILKLVDFTKRAIESNVKVVGICFGHQIVGRALGAPVGRNSKGWEASITPMKLTQIGLKVFPELAQYNGISLMQMHQDIVSELPAGTELLASTDVCPVQGIYKAQSLLTLQGHPEFTEFIVSTLIEKRKETGLFNPELVNDSLGRLHDRNDGQSVAKAVVRFLFNDSI
jgi:GMP synthase-like glutamine amidotransferase